MKTKDESIEKGGTISETSPPVVQGVVMPHQSVVCSECGKRVRLFSPKSMPDRLFLARHNTPTRELCVYGSWSDFIPS
jgi:hypothetical protein